jgi:DNA polymerase-1
MSDLRTVILDIETDSLDPKVVWVVVCKDVHTGEVHVFRRPDLVPEELLAYLADVNVCIGHNILLFDGPVLGRLVEGLFLPKLVDTLVVSRLLDFDLAGGHSLAAWGERLGCPKIEFNDYTALTEEMVEYCIQDVEVTYLLYRRFLPYLDSNRWKPSIDLEHFVTSALYETHLNGFHFDVDKARELRYNINIEVQDFDLRLLSAFPPKVGLIREVSPRTTKYGTLNRNDFRWVQDGDLSPFNGGPFSLIEYVDFNPGSPAQIVQRLNEAGWKPEEKTKGHIQALRDKKKLKKGSDAYNKNEERLAKFADTGFKVSEKNLDTLPDTAPEACKILAKRIKYASRVRVLDEWLSNLGEDQRIHGTINHIGAWTHRCSHDKPNTGNIPRDDAAFGKEMRSLWCVDDGFLVGVDAEGIQLRVLAHYMDDKDFTFAVTSGKKEDETDPHSLNRKALGPPCKSRNDAKTFIYAWLLGAGVGKVAEILGCSHGDAADANDNFLEYYPGLKELKRRQIPSDAARGYFEAFDGRYIRIFGEDKSSKEHFTLAGYLQAGEAIIMKTAMKIWLPKLKKEKVPFKLVNFVHDEWQTQVPGDMQLAEYVARTQADSIREAGEALKLRCPMAGSILSGHGGVAIGKNWYETH